MAKPIVSNRLQTAKTLVSQLIGNPAQRNIKICHLFNISYNQQEVMRLMFNAIDSGDVENYELYREKLITLHEKWCKILQSQEGV